NHPLFALAALSMGAAAVVWLTSGEGSRLSAIGIFYVGLPAVFLLWLRQDATMGFDAIIFMFLVVWTTDTMAYVSGRLVGGPKLWPRVSPNKTWSG
ncbi:phosphatidate cytidylyltransferase, partial [Acinetobacter baumannii]